MYIRIRFQILCISCLLLAGCVSQQPSAMTATDIRDLKTVLLTDIQDWWKHLHEPVIARVAGHRITVNDLDSNRNGVPPRQLLQEEINQENLAQKAEDSGYTKAPEYGRKLRFAKRNFLISLLRTHWEATQSITPSDLQQEKSKTVLVGKNNPKKPPVIPPEILRLRILARRWGDYQHSLDTKYSVWMDTQTLTDLESGVKGR